MSNRATTTPTPAKSARAGDPEVVESSGHRVIRGEFQKTTAAISDLIESRVADGNPPGRTSEEEKCYSASLKSTPPKFSIIIPAYNEHKRLGDTLRRILDYVHQQNWSAEIVAVDDGSRDDTAQIISGFAAQNPEVRLVSNPGNQGKGYAVRNGMLNARGEYLLFTDADLSSPLSEAPKLFAELAAGADVAIGSRWLDPSLQVQRQPLKRRIYSRAFNLYLRAFLGLPFHDTQCGFKAFKCQAAAAVFPMQQIMRWGFDPEILYIARKKRLKVAEVPVIWGHDERSTIHPLRDGLRMGVEVLKVRWNAIKGKYRSEIGSSGHRVVESSENPPHDSTSQTN